MNLALPLWPSMPVEAAARGGAIGLPVDASAEGWRIDHLLHFAHWATGILALVALAWLAIALVRDRKHRTARYTHGQHWREKAVPLGLAALVFFVVDGYMLYRSNADLSGSILRVESALREEGAVRVQIGARQWAWDMRYPGTDGLFDTEDDIYTVSELVVPRGAAVVYELSAMDVVHSLYLPNFRVKQDAIPGTEVRGWFRASKLGRYEIACAQHCGVHHYQMRGIVRVLSARDFADWQEAMSADALRMHEEDTRALAEEEARGVTGDVWPELPPTRDWAWAWQGAVP